jgi:hypothetical protein
VSTPFRWPGKAEIAPLAVTAAGKLSKAADEGRADGRPAADPGERDLRRADCDLDRDPLDQCSVGAVTRGSRYP